MSVVNAVVIVMPITPKPQYRTNAGCAANKPKRYDFSSELQTGQTALAGYMPRQKLSIDMAEEECSLLARLSAALSREGPLRFRLSLAALLPRVANLTRLQESKDISDNCQFLIFRWWDQLHLRRLTRAVGGGVASCAAEVTTLWVLRVDVVMGISMSVIASSSSSSPFSPSRRSISSLKSRRGLMEARVIGRRASRLDLPCKRSSSPDDWAPSSEAWDDGPSNLRKIFLPRLYTVRWITHAIQ